MQVLSPDSYISEILSPKRKKMGVWALEVAPWVTTLATKLGDFSSVPGSSMLEGGNCLKLSSDLHTHLLKKKCVSGLHLY